MSAESPQDEHRQSPDKPRAGRLRRWFPLALIAVAAVVYGVLHVGQSIEWIPNAEGFLARLALVALAALLLFAWFVFWGPAPPVVRRRAGIAGLALILAAIAVVRLDGVTGDIHPRLKWRWAPRADFALPAAASQVVGGGNVNLAETTPSDAPQFLGKDRTATFPEVRLARDWSSQPPKLLWKQPIGAGWSSFAIVGHWGVTQEQRGEEELVTCYDLDDGKLQWAHATPVRFHELVAGIGPRATPTIDEGQVYALGALGNLVCLDGATGNPLWTHDVVAETGAAQPQWGRSCSPLVYENLVIVSAGGPDGKSLLAYDKHDGKLAWRAGDDAVSYSSPALMTLGGMPQIVMINQSYTSGHDPADGRMLWEHIWPEDGIASPNIAQPIAVGGDRILLSKGYGVGSTLWQISRTSDRWQVEPLWKSNTLKTKMTNAVIRDGYAYGLDEGTLACIAIDTGRRVWKRGRYGHGQVLLVGDLLLVQSEGGQMALVEATPDGYRELTRMTIVAGQSWNYPALSGNRLVVRSDVEAAGYELPVVSP